MAWRLLRWRKSSKGVRPSISGSIRSRTSIGSGVDDERIGGQDDAFSSAIMPLPHQTNRRSTHQHLGAIASWGIRSKPLEPLEICRIQNSKVQAAVAVGDCRSSSSISQWPDGC